MSLKFFHISMLLSFNRMLKGTKITICLKRGCYPLKQLFLVKDALDVWQVSSFSSCSSWSRDILFDLKEKHNGNDEDFMLTFCIQNESLDIFAYTKDIKRRGRRWAVLLNTKHEIVLFLCQFEMKKFLLFLCFVFN